MASELGLVPVFGVDAPKYFGFVYVCAVFALCILYCSFQLDFCGSDQLCPMFLYCSLVTYLGVNQSLQDLFKGEFCNIVLFFTALSEEHVFCFLIGCLKLLKAFEVKLIN